MMMMMMMMMMTMEEVGRERAVTEEESRGRTNGKAKRGTSRRTTG